MDITRSLFDGFGQGFERRGWSAFRGNTPLIIGRGTHLKFQVAAVDNLFVADESLVKGFTVQPGALNVKFLRTIMMRR